MNDIFQIAGIGMLDGKQRLEAISQNAASASLPGFRRQVVTGRFDAALLSQDAAATGNTGVATPSTSSSIERAQRAHNGVDLQPGSVMATGRPLDLAIDGDGLFFALTDGAQMWLTRAGSLHLNEEGVLVGERGLHVVGTQGDVHLPGSDVEVTADGHITHLGETVAALQLFRPGDRASLQAAQGTLLTASDLQPAEPGAGRLRSGVLEASNTDASHEMLSLIALSRQFESLSRVVQGYDEMLGHAIEKLGEI